VKIERLILELAGESAGKAMSRIYGNIGFIGLWNGLPTRILMIGTLTGCQWLMYATNRLPTVDVY
jgi:hypothetical protein